MYELLTALDASKSTGCDGVSANILKQTACSTALPLSNLLNLSLSTGKVPHEWKTARITPIPKPAKDKKMTSGYRPISILPAASKIIEKHVKKILLNHFMTNAPISPRQWGLMESWSTISALIKVIDDWSSALDQGKEVCSGGFRGGSMEPPFGLDLVQRSTGDRLTGTPLYGLRTKKPASVAHLSMP